MTLRSDDDTRVNPVKQAIEALIARGPQPRRDLLEGYVEQERTEEDAEWDMFCAAWIEWMESDDHE